MLAINFINQLDSTNFVNNACLLNCASSKSRDSLSKSVQSIFNSVLPLIVMHPKGHLAGRYLLGPIASYQACFFLLHSKNKYNLIPYLTALQGISGLFSKQVADYMQIPIKMTKIYSCYQKNGRIHIKHAIDTVFITLFCLSNSSSRLKQAALVASSLYMILTLCCIKSDNHNPGYAPKLEVGVRRVCLAARAALGLRQAFA